MDGDAQLRSAASTFPIYIDANPLADRHLTGIGRYTARIALAIARRAPVRFFSNGKEILFRGPWDGGLDQDLGRFGRRVWKSPRIPLQVPDGPSAAIYGCLRPIERLFPFELSILHDFTPLVVPGTHSEKTRGMFQGFFAKSLLGSDRAIAVSHATKADAGWLTPFDPMKIDVQHSGPSLCVEHHQDVTAVARRPHVGLVVSTLEPRKNAFFLLDWFRNSKALDPDLELWWVGPLGWLTSSRELRRSLKMSNGRKVRFLGVVSDKTLCKLYRTAGWSVYPSLYEGFGFPVLDALRHGCPVLTSYNSALREFPNEGIAFFDPTEPESLDDAWRNRPQHLDHQAIEQLDQHYRWDRVAQAIFDSIKAHFSSKPQSRRAA